MPPVGVRDNPFEGCPICTYIEGDLRRVAKVGLDVAND